MKLDSYAGQAVMITGAASGFGALLASELAAMGARLALGDLNEAALERVAAPKLAAYAASKHAVVGLTKTAALEYARHGIRVNAVCPFYSTTPMVTDSDLGERQDFLAQGSPMKRLGRPEEIVATMLTLCAKENTYLTGQAVAVDGGVSAF
ncbi:SDR family NAD(P)-dependent oxidoreductase [Burkholderia sp. BCC1977]|uniref:SDR family NAD(P)-dependent oxidoreductase n=1 Tax=Burkholderia sp. BCC1977 TaxID=2817440 RepID=UPI002ABE682A|nr:SDR family oxidoreductase [Burkholderia sp. BCC1977]